MTLAFRNFTKTKLSQSFFAKIAAQTFKFLKIKEKTEISLAIVGARRIKTLNKKYRGVGSVTDVLAFGQSSKKNGFVEPPDRVLRLGEVVICLDSTKKQANFFGHSLKKELAILFIHGILHLLGWGDEVPKERKKMKKMEGEILRAWT